MNNIQNKQIIEEMSQMTKINSKYPKKNEEKIHCLQGATPVYHRGKGSLGGTLAIFFFSFLRCDGKPNEPHRKTQRSSDFPSKINGKRGFKCLSLSGPSCAF